MLRDLCLTKLHKFLKLRLLKLQCHKIIRFKYTKYYLAITECCNKFCAMLHLLQAVCFCGCIYNPLLLLLVCWSLRMTQRCQNMME